VALAVVSLVAACADDSSSKGAPASPNVAGGAGSGGAAGCPGSATVCIDAPARGFVVESVGTTIQAGQDVQYCEVVALPGTASDTYYVSRIDGRMTPYSHHLNVMAVAPGSAADRATTVGQRVECANNGRVPLGSGLRQIFGAVSPEASLELPEGVGHRLQVGTKLVFNYH